MSRCSGVPENITADSLSAWIAPRVSPKRFRHIEGVVAVAEKLAPKAGCDVFAATVAAWLHDACKEMKAPELVERARLYYLALDPILEHNGHLLHGPVSAEVAKRELGVVNRDILEAVAQHTLGAIDMSPLSKVIFLADCLDDSRPSSYTQPIWQALDFDGRFNMDAAIVVAIDEGLKYLIDDNKPIHPKTVTVRNYYLPAASRAAGANSGKI
ncbi:MAG TPA: bis(5'-nucleosyl)-tetraphosphatase (symmetrical) YqeK [Candidatus Obscuribacterales bacterium]